MQLIDWNIQWGRDADGGVDLSRTVAAIRALGDFDVLCLQEVTRGFGALPGRPGADQFAELAALLPGYTIIDAIGADLPPIETGAPRRQFGNAIATRLPVGRVLRQLLPWPADAGAPSMPRVALDVELQTSFGPLRVVTTHLEYYSAHQRLAQSTHCATGTARPARMRHDRRPPKTQRGRSAQPASHAMRSSAATSTARSAATPIADSWSRSRTRRASSTHGSLDTGRMPPPTAGVYDTVQWSEGPLACDFVFVTDTLLPRVTRCEIDGDVRASDHQPVLLVLA